jgi:hypothetical protein
VTDVSLSKTRAHGFSHKTCIIFMLLLNASVRHLNRRRFGEVSFRPRSHEGQPNVTSISVHLRQTVPNPVTARSMT